MTKEETDDPETDAGAGAPADETPAGGAPEAEAAEPAEAAEGAEGEEAPKKKEKKKKVVRRRKTKKERENQLTVAVRLAVESGKVEFGGRAASAAKAKLFIIAGNAPDAIRREVEYHAKKSSIPVLPFEGSSMELGSACGRPFPVSVLSVYDEGSSNILDLAKKK